MEAGARRALIWFRAWAHELGALVVAFSVAGCYGTPTATDTKPPFASATKVRLADNVKAALADADPSVVANAIAQAGALPPAQQPLTEVLQAFARHADSYEVRRATAVALQTMRDDGKAAPAPPLSCGRLAPGVATPSRADVLDALLNHDDSDVWDAALRAIDEGGAPAPVRECVIAQASYVAHDREAQRVLFQLGIPAAHVDFVRKALMPDIPKIPTLGPFKYVDLTAAPLLWALPEETSRALVSDVVNGLAEWQTVELSAYATLEGSRAQYAAERLVKGTLPIRMEAARALAEAFWFWPDAATRLTPSEVEQLRAQFRDLAAAIRKAGRNGPSLLSLGRPKYDPRLPLSSEPFRVDYGENSSVVDEAEAALAAARHEPIAWLCDRVRGPHETDSLTALNALRFTGLRAIECADAVFFVAVHPEDGRPSYTLGRRRERAQSILAESAAHYPDAAPVILNRAAMVAVEAKDAWLAEFVEKGRVVPPEAAKALEKGLSEPAIERAAICVVLRAGTSPMAAFDAAERLLDRGDLEVSVILDALARRTAAPDTTWNDSRTEHFLRSAVQRAIRSGAVSQVPAAMWSFGDPPRDVVFTLVEASLHASRTAATFRAAAILSAPDREARDAVTWLAQPAPLTSAPADHDPLVTSLGILVDVVSRVEPRAVVERAEKEIDILLEQGSWRIGDAALLHAAADLLRKDHVRIADDLRRTADGLDLGSGVLGFLRRVGDLYDRQPRLVRVAVPLVVPFVLAFTIVFVVWLIVPWLVADWVFEDSLLDATPKSLKAIAYVVSSARFFGHTDRAIEAHVARRLDALVRRCFSGTSAVQARERFADLGIPAAAARWEERVGRGEVAALWAHGRGGSGKSAMVFHLVRRRLAERRWAIPVLVDRESGLARSPGERTFPLILHVRDLLAIEGRRPTAKMVERLLRAGRLVVVFDGISERTNPAQAEEQVAQSLRDGLVRFVIVTSRELPDARNAGMVETILMGDVPPAAYRALVEAYLGTSAADATRRDAITDVLCHALPNGVRPLFVRLAIDELGSPPGIAAPAAAPPDGSAPDGVGLLSAFPLLVHRFVEKQRKTGSSHLRPADFRRALGFVAFATVRTHGKPVPVATSELRGFLTAHADAEPFLGLAGQEQSTGVVLDDLIASQLIEEVEVPGCLERSLRFVEDPIAEYVSAMFVHEPGRDTLQHALVAVLASQGADSELRTAMAQVAQLQHPPAAASTVAALQSAP